MTAYRCLKILLAGFNFLGIILMMLVRSGGLLGRGGRYYRKKLSIADKSAFLKLSANYRYRKTDIWELSKNYRYRKMCIQFHPINSIESIVQKTRETTKISRRDQKEAHYFHKET